MADHRCDGVFKHKRHPRLWCPQLSTWPSVKESCPQLKFVWVSRFSRTRNRIKKLKMTYPRPPFPFRETDNTTVSAIIINFNIKYSLPCGYNAKEAQETVFRSAIMTPVNVIYSRIRTSSKQNRKRHGVSVASLIAILVIIPAVFSPVCRTHSNK